MHVALLFLPVVQLVVAVALIHVGWWLLGDLVLEHVGVPFLDAAAGDDAGRDGGSVPSRGGLTGRYADSRRTAPHRNGAAICATQPAGNRGMSAMPIAAGGSRSVGRKNVRKTWSHTMRFEP